MAKFKFKDENEKTVLITEEVEQEINLEELDKEILHRENNITKAQEKLDLLIEKRDFIKTSLRLES